ncbi:hypothetical protein Acsp03_15080 [Actinomadura sp. NBRC 104412]|uniref:hypothetical protein n=1 Tax=Actinomadura sp. NBRC 104412 TaxID=3032203 RepID=UPI0024A00BB7|nr:hypothetical protein [Actinomadura sp. NBRC 104412]GLZ04042.1 hypothetical protein Acsp03_15080 [Actinomadura sp. NBRC 104412]
MNPTRLAVAGAASALLALGMAGPVYANPDHNSDHNRFGRGAPGGYGHTEDQPESRSPSRGFSFGSDDVKLSTNRAVPNGKTRFTVTCPSRPTISGNAYTHNPVPFTKTGKNTWEHTGTYKSTLPRVITARVTCAGCGTVTLSTTPEKGDMKPGKPTGRIPTGRIDTGDGSTQMASGLPLAAGSSAAAALAAAGLGAFALRRIGRERS